MDAPTPMKKAASSAAPAAARAKAKSRGRKRNSSSSAPSVDLSSILPWIPRGTLEGLVASSVASASAIATRDLVSAVPANERWRFGADGRKKKKIAPVRSGPERVNTGPFDGIDNVIMLNILSHLNCSERYTCVTSVCKGFREFKTSLPGLFVDLSDDGWGRSGLTASQLLVLMDWVPNLGDVTALRISTRDKCNPNTCKQIIKKLVAAKKKAKQPMITKLVLQGPKIYGSLLVEMAKHEVGANLTSLRFLSVKTTTQTKLQGSIVEFFRTLPRLEELHVPQHLATSAGSLRLTLLNPLSAARSGSSTLLRVLHLEGGNDVITFRRFNLSDLEKLGTLAPELESLRLLAVSGCPTNSNTSDPEELHWEREIRGNFLQSPMVSLPKLKEFAVGSLVESFSWRRAPRYLSTETVHRLITWLLAGMSSVETFAFGHGTTSMTRADERSFRYPPLPTIVAPGGEILWPTTLKHLKLSNFDLDCAFASREVPPSLETILLKNCGNNVNAIIKDFCSTHPGVRVTASKTRYRYAEEN